MEKVDSIMEKFDELFKRLDQIESNLSINKNSNTNKGKTYSEKEASEILKLSVRTLINYRNTGKIDYHQSAKRVLYTQENIDSFLARSKKKAYNSRF